MNHGGATAGPPAPQRYGAKPPIKIAAPAAALALHASSPGGVLAEPRLEPGSAANASREGRVATAIELGHRLRAGPSHVWQVLNDWWLNIETTHDPHAVSEDCERGGVVDYRSHYQGANYLYLEQIARLLTREAPNRLVFYDVGCGKGRPLCVMARHAFRKVVGVELRENLCAIARQNAARLRGRVAPIDVMCADAADADYSDGHVFFFFNPFGAPTLRAVLDCIERSLRGAPRQVTLIYYNAEHESVLESCPWLYRRGLLPTFSGVRVSFWRNRPGLASTGGVA